MGSQSHSAVLLDRLPLWLEAVEQVLTRLDVEVAGKATSPGAALAAIDALSPDIFVTGIDMDMGEMDGIQCLRVAKERAPHLHAIVLSMYTDTEYIDAAIEAGAFAYVIKSAHPDDLSSTIRQTFDHSLYLSAPRSPEASQLVPAAARPILTRREHEILGLLVEGHSNAQLARMMWVTEQTVKFHLSNIYRKLNASNRTEAARSAHLHGLLADLPLDRRPRLVAG